MNIVNVWQDNARGLHRKYLGEISIHHVLEATLALHEHPDFESLRYIIEDYSEATNSPFKLEEMQDFSNFVSLRSRTKNTLKIALVCRSSPEATTSAIGFCELMNQSHYQCRVFYSLADARVWGARNIHKNNTQSAATKAKRQPAKVVKAMTGFRGFCES